ncbi:MAG: methionyl-tRNA formyltransferase [Proteobacteria bacterium]|nr:methionyl-tRNA formyltransferase [Pseudomonadota bacterium]MBU1713119.1 methionyl-tRNA formyltransferase [Pseudomonadota bacterium]
MKPEQRIIFMGTPDFAVPSLKALYNSGYEVALVVTQPDRPKGRGQKVLFSPVKEAALELGYDILQPLSVRTQEFHEKAASLSPDIFVVIAFGHILPKTVLSIPKKGAINLHASLLPKYRGPAPIQWAIINMEKETGVTAMMMNEGLDTGDILLSAKTGIFPKETSASLHDRLSRIAADLLIQTLSGICTKSIKPVSQDNSLSTYAPLLMKKDGLIDWSKPADQVEAFIRGMTPWPGAFTFIGRKRIKIFASDVVCNDSKGDPGTVTGETRDRLCIATGKYFLSIKEIQEESGKRLSIKDYLRGTNIHPGTILG